MAQLVGSGRLLRWGAGDPRVHRGRRRLTSAPIKGTATGADAFCDKDFPENIMITDLVRNDLGRLATPGSVVVTELLKRELHPGLAHLVSR